MVSAESTNKNKIIFDGILLDSKYQPLIDDLRRKGISTLDQIRNTALSEYAKNKYQSQPDYLHDLRVCIAKTSDSFSYTKRWDDAIGNRVLIQLFTTEGFILSKCNSLRIRNLFDLFSLSENELNRQFADSQDFCEDVADTKRMPVAALSIPEKVVNILTCNGIMTVGKLTMTGSGYLSQLPGMNSESLSWIESALTKLPEELVNYRRITNKPIKLKSPDSAPISVDTPLAAKDIPALSTTQTSAQEFETKNSETEIPGPESQYEIENVSQVGDKLMSDLRLNSIIEENFWNWLSPKVSPNQLSEFYRYAQMLNDYFVPKHHFSGSVLNEMVQKTAVHVRKIIQQDYLFQKKCSKYDQSYISNLLDYIENFVTENRSQMRRIILEDRQDDSAKTKNTEVSEEIFEAYEKSKTAENADKEMDGDSVYGVKMFTKQNFIQYLQEQKYPTYEIYVITSRISQLEDVARQLKAPSKKIYNVDEKKAKITVNYLKYKINGTNWDKPVFRDTIEILLKYFTHTEQRSESSRSEVPEIEANKNTPSPQKDTQTAVFPNNAVSQPQKEAQGIDVSISDIEVPSTDVLEIDPTHEVINFTDLGNYSFCQPVSIRYYGKKLEINSWRSLYGMICNALLLEHPDVFEVLRNESQSGTGGLRLVDAEHKGKLIVAYPLGSGYFIEVNRSATDLIRNLKYILDRCEVDYDNVVIEYIRKETKDETVEGIETTVVSSQDDTSIRNTDTSINTNFENDISSGKDKKLKPTVELFREFFRNQGMSEYTESYIELFNELEKIARRESHQEKYQLFNCAPQISRETINYLRMNRAGSYWNTQKYRTAIAWFEKYLNYFQRKNTKGNFVSDHITTVSNEPSFSEDESKAEPSVEKIEQKTSNSFEETIKKDDVNKSFDEFHTFLADRKFAEKRIQEIIEQLPLIEKEAIDKNWISDSLLKNDPKVSLSLLETIDARYNQEPTRSFLKSQAITFYKVFLEQKVSVFEPIHREENIPEPTQTAEDVPVPVDTKTSDAPTSQPRWTLQEAAVLLDAYLIVQKHPEKRKELVRQVSDQLRQKAINQGIQISDTYRNYDGITLRMYSMETAWTGRDDNHFSSTKVFTEIVRLYCDDRNEYDSLLSEAKRLCEKPKAPFIINKEAFRKFLGKKGLSTYNQVYYCACLENMAKNFRETLFNQDVDHCLSLIKKIKEKNKVYGTASIKKEALSFFEQFIAEESNEKGDESILSNGADQNSRSTYFDNNIEDSKIEDSGEGRELSPATEEWILAYLKEKSIPYQDNRAKNGCLWMLGGHELDTYIRECWAHGYKIYYKPDGCKTFPGKEVWWTTSIVQLPSDIPTQKPAAAAPDNKQQYRDILAEYFKTGYMPGIMSRKRFKKYWLEKYQEEVPVSDEKLEQIIREICIEGEGRYFVPDAMMDATQKSQLMDYLQKRHDAGDKAVAWQVVFDDLSGMFVDTEISTPEMLQTWLRREARGQFRFEKEFIILQAEARFDPETEIKNYLHDARVPVHFDQICRDLSHIPADKIKSILNYNTPSLLYNAGNEWFNAEILDLTQDDFRRIRSLIDKNLDEQEYVLVKELYSDLCTVHPDISDQLAVLSMYGLQNYLKYKFSGSYAFNGQIISSYTRTIDTAKIYQYFARRNVPFTYEDLRELSKDLNTIIYYESTFDSCIRINAKDYVSRESVHFDIERTDEVLDRFISDSYIPLKEFRSFDLLPGCGSSWNIFLLEQYVYQFSRRFRLCHAGFSADVCAGAIVRSSSQINDFKNDLVPLALADTNVPLAKNDILNYLSKSGLIARKNMEITEEMLRKSKALRAQKGKN